MKVLLVEYSRKRKFMSYAKRREFKLYSQMEIGENLQVDHMVTPISDKEYF